MPHIEIAPEVSDDFERILEHLEQHQVEDAPSRIDEILAGIDVLESNPFIGRPGSGDLRELIIGRRWHGYIALYRYIEELDVVFVLAIRSQREAGYRH